MSPHAGAVAGTALAAVLLTATHASAAPVDSAELERCAAIPDSGPRLACFDALTRPQAPSAVSHPVQEAAAARLKPAGCEAEEHEPTLLERHWEMCAADSTQTFRFRPYRTNYLLPVRWSDSPNDQPFRPLLDRSPQPDQGLDATEVKFQLSFKLKALDDLFGSGADLWLAYTQQSHWQMYNGGVSRPFRETDYEPEVMLAVPTRYTLGPLTGRYTTVGFVHQSNGQSDPLSRSWNRVYVQTGVDARDPWLGGEFALTLKPWLRIHESKEDDDNPDIEDYIGRVELQAAYKHEKHTVSLLVRNSLRLHDNRGAVQVDWIFPVQQLGGLRLYLQVFHGYGESLIDYNHRQTTIGAGILLTDWFDSRSAE